MAIASAQGLRGWWPVIVLVWLVIGVMQPRYSEGISGGLGFKLRQVGGGWCNLSHDPARPLLKPRLSNPADPTAL